MDESKHSIYIDNLERETIIASLKQDNRIPNILNQLLEHKDPILLTPFEQGFLVSKITNCRDKVPKTWNQLIELSRRFREDAGVKITELPDNFIKLEDRDGFSITRKKYDWE